MRQPYSPFKYDRHFCLKPPALLWLALLYLSRAITLPIVVGIISFAGSFAGSRYDTHSIFQPLFDLYTLPPSLIAGAVLFALVRRSPRAAPAIRWIWTHGRALLAVSAAVDLVLSLLLSPLAHGEVTDEAKMPLLAAIFDLYFLLYVLLARYVRDVFSDFPTAAGAASK